MKIIINSSTSIIYYCLIFTLFFNSCKKENSNNPTVKVEIPSDFKLTFGQDTVLTVKPLTNISSDIKLEISFDETANIKITENIKLHDRLKEAIKLNSESKQILIKSNLLYPNSETSSINGEKIPPTYKFKISIIGKDGGIISQNTSSFVVEKSGVSIKGANKTNTIPFLYTLFSDKETLFDLESSSKVIEGVSWKLGSTNIESEKVSIINNQLKFAAYTGKLSQLEEKTYEVEPQLIKDGFQVASNKIKIIFIPAIQFVYGTYYPDLDLNIKYNYLIVDLLSGYKSAAPAFYPEKYKGKFSIELIEMNTKEYDNSKGIFSIDENTGVITVKANNELKPSKYKLTIKATANNGLEFTTPITLVLE